LYWHLWGKFASVSIPNSVTSIGGSAFFDCTSLATVTFEGTIPSNGFSDILYGGYTLPGNLRAKYLASAGGIGTYTTTNPEYIAVRTEKVGLLAVHR
jgi:hypothetical protein